MGLFDKFKNKNININKKDYTAIDKSYNAEKAHIAKEKFWKFYEKNDESIKKFSEIHEVKLDYSIESVNEVMKLLKDAREAFKRKEISERICSNIYCNIRYIFGRNTFKEWTF